MPMLTVQVKLPEEIVKKIDALRGPEIGWTQSAVARHLVERALAQCFFMPERSVNKPDQAQADHPADAAA